MNQTTLKNKQRSSKFVSQSIKHSLSSWKLSAVTMSVMLGLSQTAFAASVAIHGTVTSSNGIAIGTDSFTTAVNGVANGKSAVATGNGFTRDEFNTKKQEVSDLTTAKDKANADLNNLNNDKSVNELTQQVLNNQIVDTEEKLANAADKIAQRETLTQEKSNKENLTSGLTQAVNNAQADYDAILQDGKNLYLNFTEVLQGLDWNKLNQTDGRTELAKDLKTKIEGDFPDFADKYSVERYKNLVDGYTNKQAGYEGSFHSIGNSVETLINNNLIASNGEMKQKLKDINQAVLPVTNYFGLNEKAVREHYEDKFSIDEGRGSFQSVLNNREDEWGRLLFRRYNLWGSTDINTENEKKAYNSVLLASLSKAKMKSDGMGDYISSILHRHTLDTNSIRGYHKDDYRILNGGWLIFKVKTTDGKYVDPLVRGTNLAYLNLLMDKAKSNNDTLTVEEIREYNKYYNDIREWYGAIDWNDTDAAYELAPYKAQVERVLSLSEKIKKYNDTYSAILAEKDKSVPDQTFIDNQTATLLNLYNDLLNEKSNPENFLQNYRLVLTDKANEYFNYAKVEADSLLNRMANELIKYDKDDAIVVDVTNKARDLQDALSKAKEDAANNQNEINELQKQIDELALTPQEEAAAQTKKDLEKQLEEAQKNQATIDKSIADKTKEIEELVKKLENSSLKDLGLRSQAYGDNAFASGDDSIAMGTNATVIGNKSVAIGSNNNVASDNVMVLGNDVTVGKGFNNAVVLGNGSTATQATPVASYEIDGKTYDFAGTNPTSTVSVGAEGKERQITHVAAGRISATSTDAINGSQLYAVAAAIAAKVNAIPPKGDSATVIAKPIKGGNGVTITVNPQNEQEINVVGVTTVTDDGKSHTRSDLSQPVGVKGDGKNIRTTTATNGDVQVQMADDLKVNSITINNGPVINQDGINMNNNRISGVENGVAPKDAVNVSQLTQQGNQLNSRINQVEDNLRKQNKMRKAGHASSLATAGLMQPHRAGQSGVTAAVGQYQGQTAVAVGYSRLSDNGKYGLKLSLTTNTQKEVGGTVGAGYFW